MVRILVFFLVFLGGSLTSSFASAKEKPQVTLTQSAQQVWQRQQTIITLKLKTDDPFSRLEIEPFQQKGFSIIAYKQQRTENKDHVLLTMKWALYPFVAGSHQLELPEIVYRPNGGRKQKLTLNTLSLNVKRLPVYVPPTMPVGKISLHNAWDESWLTSPNNLLEWQITVTGEGVAQQTMPPITRQLINTKTLKFLPAQSVRKTRLLDQGITNLLKYNVPLKATMSGIINFPDISVQYFEPITGKLQTTTLSPPFVLSINKWLLGIVSLLIFFGFAFLMLTLFKILIQKLKNLTQKKHALQQLKQAQSYQQIRNALDELSEAHNWNDNLSLSEFTKEWEMKFGASPELRETIKSLQSLQFANDSPLDFSKISKNLIKHIKY